MGDVAPDRGVSAHVLVRALRRSGYYMQQLVHEDMKRHFDKYPNRWGLRRPDPNIDHRRVPNLMTFFERHGTSLPLKRIVDDYQPGDILAWQLDGGLTHKIVVVSGKGSSGCPLVVHNIGRGQVRENVLFAWPVIGHYRFS